MHRLVVLDAVVVVVVVVVVVIVVVVVVVVDVLRALWSSTPWKETTMGGLRFLGWLRVMR